MLDHLLLFTCSSSIQFLNSLPFLDTVSYNTLDSLHLTAQPLCDLRDAMRRHWSPVLPTQPLPREAEHIAKGGKHFNHVPLLTELIYVSPKALLSRFY